MTKVSSLFATLLAEQQKANASLPPVDKWNPSFCGDMDLLIQRDGTWLHEGSAIRRPELVKLFSTVLKREGDDYYLVTPVEKLRIRVECAPFLLVEVERKQEAGGEALYFTANTGDHVVAGPENPIWMEPSQSGEELLPYIRVRSNLPGLLSRTVYYQLADWAQAGECDGRSCHGVVSLGQFFPLE
ncbi:DUF1285 domain-containing protein [Porticoccus sp. W117]|uniref:DUF1285 domain-containing protein n=1 Tax=Porticoccus sp. W117 TaxID=3054777 RepID=UPI0025932A6E|nr:DUF1285 domain-containing protein [Porticoccus sp. W117]MDM3871963.1 DUF1285 domain-containing protein [Porticoccus sp. W117]